MNLCYFCKFNLHAGKGCGHKNINPHVGDRFPLGIRVEWCSAFDLRRNEYSDVKFNVMSDKIYYVYTKSLTNKKY